MSWEFRGVVGRGETPPYVGTCSGTLLVVGSGRGVWDDLERYLPPLANRTLYERLMRWSDGQTRQGDVMAVNEVGIYLQCGLKHWASLHGDHLLRRHALRRSHGNCRSLLHSDKPHEWNDEKIDALWDFPNLGALSGLFAAKIGVALGYDLVVMAGCPMDDSGKFHDPPTIGGMHGDPHVAAAFKQEMAQRPDFKARLRSMSGLTRELLGEPELCAV